MNIAANTILQMPGSGGGQMPPAPPAAGQKREESAFEALMRQKYRSTRSDGKTGRTDSDSTDKTLAENSGRPSVGNTEDAISDEQYALAAALSAPAVGIFMPVQEAVPVIVEEPQMSVVQTVEMPAAALKSEASGLAAQQLRPVQTADTADAAESIPQKTQAMPLSTQPNAPAQKETLTVVGKPGDGAGTERFSDADAQDQPEVLLAQPAQKTVFEDVRGTPIKVGEAQDAPLDTQASDLDVQLARRLEGAMQQGDSRVAIQLTPENLGMVQVQITRSSDGSLSVLLSASGEKALSLLERHSAGLQSLLMTNAQAPVRIEVQPSHEGQQAQQQLLDQDGGSRQGQQQGRQENPRNQTTDPQDFIQQLRLGLVGRDEMN